MKRTCLTASSLALVLLSCVIEGAHSVPPPVLHLDGTITSQPGQGNGAPLASQSTLAPSDTPRRRRSGRTTQASDVDQQGGSATGDREYWPTLVNVEGTTSRGGGVAAADPLAPLQTARVRRISTRPSRGDLSAPPSSRLPSADVSPDRTISMREHRRLIKDKDARIAEGDLLNAALFTKHTASEKDAEMWKMNAKAVLAHKNDLEERYEELKEAYEALVAQHGPPQSPMEGSRGKGRALPDDGNDRGEEPTLRQKYDQLRDRHRSLRKDYSTAQELLKQKDFELHALNMAFADLQKQVDREQRRRELEKPSALQNEPMQGMQENSGMLQQHQLDAYATSLANLEAQDRRERRHDYRSLNAHFDQSQGGPADAQPSTPVPLHHHLSTYPLLSPPRYFSPTTMSDPKGHYSYPSFF